MPSDPVDLGKTCASCAHWKLLGAASNNRDVIGMCPIPAGHPFESLAATMMAAGEIPEVTTLDSQTCLVWAPLGGAREKETHGN